MLTFVTFTCTLSIEIKAELKKNILKFCYGINYKYEGTLHILLKDFYIKKFNLPSIKDLKFSKLNYDSTFAHLAEKKWMHC